MVINVSKISECHAKLNKIGEINFDNVKNTGIKIRRFLSKNSPERLKELAKMNCFAANKVKTVLDKKYGENNYVVIAIGRSVSSIAELLKTMGVETKNIPLSGLRKRAVKDIPADYLHIYKSYLVQIGLSKTDLKNNSDKTYVIMDYSNSGKSLKRAEEMLKSDCLLGDAKNLTAVSINELLGKDYKKRKFEDLFNCSRFKDYSSVGKLHIDNLDNVFEVCSPERVKEYQGNITQGLRKLFWFNTFNFLDKNNFKSIKPVKEFNAVNAHFYNINAIRNKINMEYKKIKYL